MFSSNAKINIFWGFFKRNSLDRRGLRKEEDISKNVDFSLWCNCATTRTRINIYCTIFPFFAYCATNQLLKTNEEKCYFIPLKYVQLQGLLELHVFKTEESSSKPHSWSHWFLAAVVLNKRDFPWPARSQNSAAWSFYSKK